MKKGVYPSLNERRMAFVVVPLLRDHCRGNSRGNKEQKTKITIFIHTPKTQENESFLGPN